MGWGYLVKKRCDEFVGRERLEDMLIIGFRGILFGYNLGEMF